MESQSHLKESLLMPHLELLIHMRCLLLFFKYNYR